MCGRAVQTTTAVSVAAQLLGLLSGGVSRPQQHHNVTSSHSSSTINTTSINTVATVPANNETLLGEILRNKNDGAAIVEEDTRNVDDTTASTLLSHGNDNDVHTMDDVTKPQVISNNYKNNDKNNYNLCPGMDAVVFWVDHNQAPEQIQMGRKVWGLVTQNGTAKNPLPNNKSIHFSNLMFNARSDTLYEKVTFRKLLLAKRTCLIALDGFFEWKLPALQKKKQPYFIFRKYNGHNDDDSPVIDNVRLPPQPLLMPGLWTTVSTGRPEDPVLETFTIITTEACQELQWVHERMPVCIRYNNKDNNHDTSHVDLIKEWLGNPTPTTFAKITQQQHEQMSSPAAFFQWYAVTTEMSNVKYRSILALKPIKITQPSLTSFFTAGSGHSKAKKTECTESNVAGDQHDGTKKQKRTTRLSDDPDIPSLLSAASTSASSLPAAIVATPNKKIKTTKTQQQPSTTPAKSNNKNKGTLLSYFSPTSKTAK